MVKIIFYKAPKPIGKWFFLLVIIFFQKGVLAQSRMDSIHAVYDSIQLKFFPSGILHNRSPYYAMSQDSSYHPNPYDYQGSPNSPICLSDDFNRLQKDLYFAAIDSNRIWPPSSQMFYDSLIGSRYEMPLKVMHTQFHRLKEHAVDSGYILFDSLKNYYLPIRDTTWIDRAHNLFVYKEKADSLGHLAFELHTCFALCCIKPTIVFEQPHFEVDFIIHAISVIENIAQIPDYVEIDYGDGVGLRKTLVQPPITETIKYKVQVSCLQEEYKKKIRVRFHYLDTVFESSTYLFLEPSEQLKKKSLAREVSLIPNPGGRQVLIHFECPVQNGRLRVFSSGGKVIYEDNIQHDSIEHMLELDAGAGVYFIELNSDSLHQVILKWVSV